MKLFSKAEEAMLAQLHPDEVKVIRQCARDTKLDWVIIQTARSSAEQKKNLAKGVSATLHSRHVPSNNLCKVACAADIAVREGKLILWKRWDLFEQLNREMMAAAWAVHVPLEWGGNWHSPKDGDHWQLPWHSYP